LRSDSLWDRCSSSSSGLSSRAMACGTLMTDFWVATRAPLPSTLSLIDRGSSNVGTGLRFIKEARRTVFASLEDGRSKLGSGAPGASESVTEGFDVVTWQRSIIFPLWGSTSVMGTIGANWRDGGTSEGQLTKGLK
jgi:hypothetical protein